jgi:hypothetical protein
MNITKLYQINTNQRKFTKSICSTLCFGIFMDFSCPLPLSGAVAPSYMALRRGKWSRWCNPKASKPSPWHNRKSSNRTGFEQWFPVYVFIYICIWCICMYIYDYIIYASISMYTLFTSLPPLSIWLYDTMIYCWTTYSPRYLNINISLSSHSNLNLHPHSYLYLNPRNLVDISSHYPNKLVPPSSQLVYQPY